MTWLPLRGNALGLAMIVVTGAIAGLGSLALHLPDLVVMLGVGGALVVMDLLIRWMARPARGWLLQSQFGGYLFVAPAWGVGLLIIAANLAAQFIR